MILNAKFGRDPKVEGSISYRSDFAFVFHNLKTNNFILPFETIKESKNIRKAQRQKSTRSC